MRDLHACSSVELMAPWAGFQFLVATLFCGVLVVLVGLLVNNLAAKRVYPTFWW